MKAFTCLLGCVVCLFGSCLLAGAATVWVPETFGDGGTPTANGWTLNHGGPVADAGDEGIGDHAAQYTAANPLNSFNGFHFLHPTGGSPNAVFLGDYLAAGATAIRFKARHSGIGDSVVLRVYAFGEFTNSIDFAFSLVPLTIANTATSWQTYTMSLNPDDFFSNGPNTDTPSDVFKDVAQIGLRHDPDGAGPITPRPVADPTTVFFDDVMLIPEPMTAGLSKIALVIGIAFVRRKRRYNSP